MPCGITDPIGCGEEIVGGVAGGVGDVVTSTALSAWEAVCQSFADAAVALLEGFAKAFVAFPTIDVESSAVRNVYGLSVGLAAIVAAILFLIQVGRTVLSHDGSGLSQGLVGLGKAALAIMVTLSVAGAALLAANELAAWIVTQTFDDAEGLRKKLTAIMATRSPQGQASLVLVLAVVGIILTLVLWFELLLSNAAVAVLVATAPIAAAGQIGETTKSWWPKLASATAQLIILKPVIALVFAVGFGIAGDADPKDVGTLLSGMLILLLAALAWPAIARFFAFTTIHVGGGAGLAAVLGFGAGTAMRHGGGGAAIGMDPEHFGQAAEARTLASMAARGNAGAATAGRGMGGGALAALDLAQRAANSLTGRMEQTAGHAGLQGHNPNPYVAGYPQYYGGRARSGGQARRQSTASQTSGGALPDESLDQEWSTEPPDFGSAALPTADSSNRASGTVPDGPGPPPSPGSGGPDLGPPGFDLGPQGADPDEDGRP